MNSWNVCLHKACNVYLYKLRSQFFHKKNLEQVEKCVCFMKRNLLLYIYTIAPYRHILYSISIEVIVFKTVELSFTSLEYQSCLVQIGAGTVKKNSKNKLKKRYSRCQRIMMKVWCWYWKQRIFMRIVLVMMMFGINLLVIMKSLFESHKKKYLRFGLIRTYCNALCSGIHKNR